MGVEGGRPLLAGPRRRDRRGATGFRQAFSWLDLPAIGADGWPREERGVATDVPGLFFCGLSMQSSFRSMLVGGAGEDARYVAGRVAAHGARFRRTSPGLTKHHPVGPAARILAVRGAHGCRRGARLRA